MEAWFLGAGMALCLLCLGILARRDWARLTGIGRTVDAEVIGHRISREADGTSYAATYRFQAEGAWHEVHDEVLHTRPQPPVGTRVSLSYPFGRPDLAHVPRPLMWLAVYGLLLFLLAMLAAKALGWLPQPGN